MTMILLAGHDEPLLEGLAQTLAAAGHRSRLARSAADAVTLARTEAPQVVLLDRAWVADLPELRTLRLRRGGAFIVYGSVGPAREPLPPAMQRLTLAEVALPLERQRVVALVDCVMARARAVGAVGAVGHDAAHRDPGTAWWPQ